MKKLYLITFSAIMMTFLTVACQGKELKIADYFTFKANTAYHYKGTGADEATQSVYMDFINTDENLYQRRILAKDNTVGECLSIKDGELVLYFGDQDFRYFMDMTKTEPSNTVLFLKEPLKMGEKWKRCETVARISNNPDVQPKLVNVTAEVTGIDVEVTVPYGTFKALEITEITEGTEMYKKEYYAEGIGLIKSVTNACRELYSDMDVKLVGIEYVEVISELEEIEEDASYSSDEYFFFADKASGEVKIEERQISFKTNDDPKTVLEKALRNYDNADMRAFMGDDVKINKVDTNFKEGRVRVDFSKELITKMNSLSPEYEELTLQALVNTLGYYFYSPQVCINIDGEGYKSNNIAKGYDEYLNVAVNFNYESEE